MMKPLVSAFPVSLGGITPGACLQCQVRNVSNRNDSITPWYGFVNSEENYVKTKKILELVAVLGIPVVFGRLVLAHRGGFSTFYA